MKRIALCVGNNYPGSGNDLRGCVNDMEDWGDTLARLGYTVTGLEEGTKAQIMGHLADMLASLRLGDRFVFQFSGHGTWVPDADGDEADGRDEAICPADFRRAGVITDDELFAVLGTARLGRRIIISDSCYSGTVTRAFRDGEFRPRFIPPGEFLSGAQLDAARRVERVVANSKPRGGAVLLSGCSENEVSYDAEFGGRPNGAFTKAALTALTETTTIGDWHKRIRTQLPSHRYPQSPALTARSYQKLWKL